MDIFYSFVDLFGGFMWVPWLVRPRTLWDECVETTHVAICSSRARSFALSLTRSWESGEGMYEPRYKQIHPTVGSAHYGSNLPKIDTYGSRSEATSLVRIYI